MRLPIFGRSAEKEAMSEEESLSTKSIEWLQTKTGVIVGSFLMALVVAAAAILKKELSKEALLLGIAALATLLALALLAFAVAANRLRAKISKLDKENRSLREPPSEIDADSLKILEILYDDGPCVGIDDIQEKTGLGRGDAETCFDDLDRRGYADKLPPIFAAGVRPLSSMITDSGRAFITEWRRNQKD
ncbi:MAG: hypothetical protein WD342_04995 [Verrucomicrobiales bacterium]